MGIGMAQRVRIADIAEELGFKKSSVSVAMKNLRQKEHITVTKEGNVKIDEYSALKQTVLSLFDVFCNLEGNFVVNMPYITIRNNGQLVGTKYRFHIENDADIRVDYTKQEFVKHEDISDELFVNTIASYMKKLMISNYVFINKNASGFKYGPNGELIFVLYATGRRKYFFKSR